MELLAAIVALEALKEPCQVKLCSDSEYLVQAMTLGWVHRWKSRSWRKTKNPDLWVKLLEQCERHQVEFLWVKGHAGVAENERCDQLAIQASKGENLLVDEIYEAGIVKKSPEEAITSNDGLSNNEQRFHPPPKITEEGQPCRKCSTPVIKHVRREDKPVKANRSYYYEYFFICPKCNRYYYVEDAIRYVDQVKIEKGKDENPRLF
jgi:ribonuclease HI